MNLTKQAFSAAKNGDLRKLKRCIRKGFDPMTFDDFYGWTVLTFAARWGHIHIVRYLLRTVKIRGYVNRSHHNTRWTPGPTATALHVACERYTYMVYEKLQRKKNTIESIIKTQIDIIRLLIQYGGDVHHRDCIGFTPYVRASIGWDRSDEILKLLEDHGCSEKDMYASSTIKTLLRVHPFPSDLSDVNVCYFLLKRRYKTEPIPRSYANHCVEWYLDHKRFFDDDDTHVMAREYIRFLYTYNRK